MKEKPILIEYIGPSGAGKTTLARKKIKEIRSKGERVLTFNYYQDKKLMLVYDLCRFPFFMIRNRDNVRGIYRLFKEDVAFYTRIKETIIIQFVMFKTTNLVERARQEGVKKVILDQGFVQQMSSFFMRGFLREKEVNDWVLDWIKQKAQLYVIEVEVSPEVAAERRLKRKARHDVKKSKKRLIEEGFREKKIRRKVVKRLSVNSIR